MDKLTGNSILKDDKISLLTPGNDPNEKVDDLATDTKVYRSDLSTDLEAHHRNDSYKQTAVLCVSLAIAATLLIGGLSLIAILTHSNVFDEDNLPSEKVFKTDERDTIWKSIDKNSSGESGTGSDSSEELIIDINTSEEIVVDWSDEDSLPSHTHTTSSDSEDDDNWWSSESGEGNESDDMEYGQPSSSIEYADYEETLESSSDELKSGESDNITMDQSSCKDDSINAPVCTDETCKQLAANMKAYINESYDPCENFYKFSCAGWIDSHPVLNNVTDQLDVLQLMDIDNINILKHILEDRDSIVKSKAEKKARDFYVSCINQDTDKSPYSDEDDDSYLSSAWDWLKSNHSKVDIIQSHEKSNQFNYRAFMEFIPAPRNYLINKNQAGKSIHLQMKSRGTTLPQDHYLEDSEVKKNTLVDYHEYLIQIRKLSKDEKGGNELKAEIKAFVEFEKRLALIQPNPMEEKSQYLNTKQMANLIPYPSWKKPFEHQMNVLKKESSRKLTFALSPSDQQYLKSLKALFKHQFKTEEGRKILKNHLTWNSLKSRMNFFKNHAPQSALLKNALGLDEESTVESTEMSTKCAKETMKSFPEVTGRLFVLESLSSEKEEASHVMFKTLKHTYKNLISNVSWMDSRSKSSVLKKLSALPSMNGYPDSIMDLDDVDDRYRSVVVSNNTYLANLRSLTDGNFLTRLVIQIANKEMEIMTANAYYDRKDDIVEIPSGILQEPLFDAKYPKLISYAKLGVVMGHEMSHAFQKYYYRDCTSRICNDNPDDPRKCVEDMYDNFRVNHKYMVDGVATVEENFGDIAGFKVAYNAYKNNYCQEYQSLPGLQKFTRDQLFFISTAQFYCRSMRSKISGDTLIEEQVNEDSHSPHSVRVAGTFTNTKEFADAFNCPVGSLYNLADKCEIF